MYVLFDHYSVNSTLGANKQLLTSVPHRYRKQRLAIDPSIQTIPSNVNWCWECRSYSSDVVQQKRNYCMQFLVNRTIWKMLLNSALYWAIPAIDQMHW